MGQMNLFRLPPKIPFPALTVSVLTLSCFPLWLTPLPSQAAPCLPDHLSCRISWASVQRLAGPQLWDGLGKIAVPPRPPVEDKCAGRQEGVHEKAALGQACHGHMALEWAHGGGARVCRPSRPGGLSVGGPCESGGRESCPWATPGKDCWNGCHSLFHFWRPNPSSPPSQPCGYTLISLAALDKALNVIWVPQRLAWL